MEIGLKIRGNPLPPSLSPAVARNSIGLTILAVTAMESAFWGYPSPANPQQTNHFPPRALYGGEGGNKDGSGTNQHPRQQSPPWRMLSSMPRASLLPFALILVLAPASAAGPAAQQPKPQPAQTKPLFSEDFESGKLDPNVWTQQITGDSAITVQQDKVAHGKYALKVSCPTPAQRTHAYLMAKDLPEALRHHLFGRAYVYVTPGVPDRHTIFLTAGTTGFPKYRYEEVATAHNKFQLTYVDTTIQGPLGEDYHAAGEIPLNRWFLLEWEFNDQPDQAAVWVDGELVLDTPFIYKTTSQSTDLVGGFTNFSLGFFLWGAAPVPFDIYYDDFALDTHRIGAVK